MKQFKKLVLIGSAILAAAPAAMAQAVLPDAAAAAALVTGPATTAANAAMALTLVAAGLYGVVRFVKWIRK